MKILTQGTKILSKEDGQLKLTINVSLFSALEHLTLDFVRKKSDHTILDSDNNPILVVVYDSETETYEVTGKDPETVLHRGDYQSTYDFMWQYLRKVVEGV